MLTNMAKIAPTKVPFVVARQAGNFLFRHIGCRYVMRSRGCAMQNQGITLNAIKFEAAQIHFLSDVQL